MFCSSHASLEMTHYHRIPGFEPHPREQEKSRPRALSILNKRNPFSGPTTPSVLESPPEFQEETDYFKPPSQKSRPNSVDQASLDEALLPSPNKTRLKPGLLIHPLALLPAFLLGILVTLPYGLRNSSSAFIQNKSGFFFFRTQQHTHSLPIHHRDHVYFPSDYLNRSWTLQPTPDQYPILQLIHNASLAWNAKLSRQSKSLPDAVREYQKRYHRHPPTGFEHWYDWATKNDVILIDEFDRVNELIEPFWALPPAVLRNRTEEAGKNEAFSTFVIKNGQVHAIGPKKDAPRTIDQLKLLEVIAPHLPDVNVTMSHHDGPSVFVDWVTKKRHIDYARAGKVLPEELIDKVEDDASLWGFVGACSPDSPMRMLANGLGQNIQVQGAGPGGYIGLEHAKTMDLCDHPEWQQYHGFTAWAGPRPLPLRPIFSFAQSPGFVSDILNAPLEQFEDSTKNADQVKTWEQKGNSKQLLWRGQTTGVWFDRQTNWRKSHRVRLHRLGVASKHAYGQNLKRMLRTPSVVGTNSTKNAFSTADPHIRLVEKEYSLAQLSHRFLDASFVGELVQCTVEDSSCEAISKELEFSTPVDWQFQNNFKYVLDVDGNSWSGRFRRLLKSNSVVFKSTIWPEWYRDRIQGWYHYVPVRIDYEDVFDLMSFFTGGDVVDDDRPDLAGFEDVARRIAGQGSQWADQHFRYQDIRAYVWRTYLEWARVSSDNRLQMNFGL